jgi:hypothetical protein
MRPRGVPNLREALAQAVRLGFRVEHPAASSEWKLSHPMLRRALVVGQSRKDAPRVLLKALRRAAAMESKQDPTANHANGEHGSSVGRVSVRVVPEGVRGRDLLPRPSPPLPALALVTEGYAMQTENPPAPQPGKPKYSYKPELDDLIRQHFAEFKWERGAARALYVYIAREHPGLLVDLAGKKIGQATFSSHCGSMLARAHARGEPDVPAAAGPCKGCEELARARAEGEAFQRQVIEVLSAARVCADRIWALAADGDIDTLRAVRALLAPDPGARK